MIIEPLAGALMAGRILAACDSANARGQLQQLIDGAQIVLLACEEGDTGADSTRVAARAEQHARGWTLSSEVTACYEAGMAFRLGTVDGRAVLVEGDGVFDLARASHGRCSSDPPKART